MSTDSFKRYQEEMKQKVIREASSNNLHALTSSTIKSRRASTGMRDMLQNDYPSPSRRYSSSQNLRGHPKPTHRVQKSLSLDDGLDQLITSFISSFRDGDERRNRTSAHLIQSKSRKSDGQLEIEGSSELKSGLSSEELQVLTKMMRRLSNAERDRTSEPQERCNDELIHSDTWHSTNRISSTETLFQSNCHPKIKNSSKGSSSYVASMASTHSKVDENENCVPVPLASDAQLPNEETLASFDQSEATLSKAGDNGDDFVSRFWSTNLSTQVLTVPSTMWSGRSSLSTSSTRGQPALSRPYHQRKETMDSGGASFHTAKMERSASLDTRFLKMPVFGREQSTGSSRIDSKSSQEQSRTLSETTMDSGGASFHTAKMERSASLDTRFLKMPVFGREQSTGSSRIDSKSSQEQSRTLSETAVQATLERGGSLSTNSSHDRNPVIAMPQLNRFQSTNTTGAVVCDTDDFLCTMEEFNDEVQRQKIKGYLIESPLSQTRHSSTNSQLNSFSRKNEFSAAVNSSSALLSAAAADLDGPPLKQDCGDLLAEGIEHLSMAMLVNIYGKLREMSLLGHVSVKLRDIDVNSHQYNSRKKELKRLGRWTAADEAKGYLDTTRKAGFIVRTVMDEHELFEADHARGADSDIKHALLAYDAR
jgi:hypothetical protein